MKKAYDQMDLEELKFERNKLRDRDGDEPVRARFLKATLDSLIRIRTQKSNDWVIRDEGQEFASVEQWKRSRFTTLLDLEAFPSIAELPIKIK